MATLAVRFTNNISGANQVVIIMPPSRTILVGFTSDDRAFQGARLEFAGVESRIALREGLDRDVVTSLTLRVEGEIPREVRVFAIDGGPELRLLAGGDATTSLDTWKSSVRRSSNERFDGMVRARDSAIADLKHSKPALSQALDYFRHLDEETGTPFLTRRGNLTRRDLVHRTAMLLRTRLEERCRVSPPTTLSQIPNADLDCLSVLQLALVREHFGGGDIASRAVDVGAFDSAFLAFASGQLDTNNLGGLWNGRPDSGFFFFFAEFAFAALPVACDADRALWLELLPSLVHAQRIFQLVFEPSCPFKPDQPVDVARLNFGSYFKDPVRSTRVGEALSLVEKHRASASRKLSDLALEHVSNAKACFPAGFGPPVDPCDILLP